MQKPKTAFTFLLNSIKPFKYWVGLHLFVVLYNAIDLSLWPYVSKILIDQLAITPREQIISQIWPTALLLIILGFLPGFVWRICDYSWMHLTPLMRKKIASESMDYAMQHSNNFFQNNFAGSLANKVRDLTGLTDKLLATIIYAFLGTILSLIIAFFTLLLVHKFFAFGLLAWAALFIFMAVKGAKKVSPMSIATADQQTKIMGNLVDVLGNISNVRLFSRRGFESNRIKALQDDYAKFSKRRDLFLIKFYTLQGLTFSVYFAGCIILLIWLYAQNRVTLGDFMLIFTVNTYIIHGMWQAMNEMRTFLENVGTVNQALSIINQPLQIKDCDNEKDLKITRGEIIFENVGFSYDNSSALFCDKNITIKAGQKIGLVGKSGGGKTTFVNLILRLFDVEQGRILIDGQNISSISQDSLRASIGVIPQDPSLFHRTLLQNISYGCENASEPEIIAAAKKAHAHEFIQTLPESYNSLVGERGVKLSGGQRQRIAIARAFLKNAPILILDEATSQLDSINENLIQESLTNLMKQKTTIVIAHRLSTLQHMDRILVFDSGKIIEDGSHQELLALNGFYQKLWQAQVGGFLNEDYNEK
jgi:ATP-binding cassette subfamily B protein